jgi:hypothetical protein|tara:strand:+ start:238679 stop:239023 length:345 start_codon:yes stop_codon:yes gene_type:complete
MRPTKQTSIALLSTVFNTAYMNDKTQRKNKSLNACVTDIIEQNGFDIKTPLEIITADEYATLYTQAFKAASQHFTAQATTPNYKSVDAQANKFISYLSGNGIITVAKNLKQEIY